MPQLPVLQLLITEAGRVVRRFPLTLLCAGVIFVAGCQVITYLSGAANQPAWTFPLLSAGLLGLPLTLGELRRGADTPGFWRYNERLLLRLLTAGLYAGVLFVGGALALVAGRELFGWEPLATCLATCSWGWRRCLTLGFSWPAYLLIWRRWSRRHLTRKG